MGKTCLTAVVLLALTTVPTRAIVGGSDVKDGDFAAASLAIITDGTQQQGCTGTLIGDDLILTAAHCVTQLSERIETGDAASATLKVVFGADPFGAPAARLHDVVGIRRHENYTARNENRNDLAVVRFRGPRPPGAQTVSLATRADLQTTMKAVVAGYGRTNGQKDDAAGKAGRLHAAPVPAVIVDAAKPEFISFQEGSGACFGDSGGPLLVKDAGGKPVLIGVVAVAPEASKAEDHCTASVISYTNVSVYAAWIDAAAKALASVPATDASAAPAQADVKPDAAVAESEERLYRAASNSKSALELYLKVCRICAFKAAALEEIGKLTPAPVAAPPKREWRAIAAALWRSGGKARVAVGSSGILDTAGDAEREALRQCRSAGGTTCRIIRTYNSGCYYIATGHTRKSVVWTLESTPSDAVRKCRAGGNVCTKGAIGGCVDSPANVAAAPSRPAPPPPAAKPSVRTQLIDALKRCNSPSTESSADERLAGCRAVIALEPQADRVEGVPLSVLKENFKEARNLIARLLIEKKDFAAAIAAANEGLGVNPDNYMLFGLRGRAYAATNEVEPAMRDFDRAIALDPTCAECFAGRAALHKAKDNPDQALADVSRAVALEPAALEHLVLRGMIYYDKKMYDQAIADYDKAIGALPALARVLGPDREKAVRAREKQAEPQVQPQPKPQP